MGIVLALVAAVTYGVADFFGGLATKRSAVWTVVVLTGLCGLATALACVPLLSPAPPPPRDLEIGAVIGLASAAGLATFYRGLAVARMSIVAPITAVLAAVVPVIYGAVRGERLSAVGFAGIALALVAVFFVSRASDEDVAGQPEPARFGVVYGLGAGFAFGLIFVLLSATSRGVWPLVMSRCVSVVIVGVSAAIAGRLTRPAPGSAAVIIAAGVLDMAANVAYLLALRNTLISIAAVVTSLYPASTVLLARIVLHERLGPVQWLGVGCAFIGVILLSLP